MNSLSCMILATVTILQAQEDYPTGTVHLTPEIDLDLRPKPLIVPDQFRTKVPDGSTVNLPPGFSVNVFAATGLRGPRLMALSPDGVLHVANTKVGNSGEFESRRAMNNGAGQIVALPDLNRDGIADTVKIVADGFWWINSLEFFEGHLYAGDTHQILRLSDADDDGFYEKREVFAPLPTCGHNTRTIVVDDQNRKLYVSIGSSHDLTREEDPECATVLQFDVGGSRRRIFARGLRNAVGLTLHPKTNQLRASNNGHDREGPNLPPEFIDVVRDGGFYGFPIAYGYQVPVDYSIRDYAEAILPWSRQDSLDFNSMQRPAAQIPAHMAPMGIHFYSGNAFPDQYRGAAFVSLRGGSEAGVPGYKVIAIFDLGEGGDTRRADFLTGFQRVPRTGSENDVWGKPVGVISDVDGSLYVTSDWYSHLILKITHERSTTAILEERPSELPADFELAQNHPTPFNAETSIAFSLPRSAVVNLDVFALTGQKITSLIQGHREPGTYVVRWDGTNDAGKIIGTGTYIYQLQTSGKAILTRKLLLVR